MTDRDLLKQLEENLLSPAARKDAELVSSLLADEFREFGSSGRCFSKQDVIEELRDECMTSLTLKDFEAMPLSESAALVTYRAAREVSSSPPSESLRSSIWIFREGRWQMLFHQGTQIPPF